MDDTARDAAQRRYDAGLRRCAPLFAGAAIVLASCGGGTTGATSAPVPAQTSPALDATATITVLVPDSSDQVAQAHARTPLFISPGTDKISILVDGISIVSEAQIAKLRPADRLTSVTSTSVNGLLAVKIGFKTAAGKHTLGIVLNSNLEDQVLSEGQTAVTVGHGDDNDLGTLSLLGVAASGYIECATESQIAAGNTCKNYANLNNGTYTFTAVAADYAGYPIFNEIVNRQPLRFDNGAFSVTESDGKGIVSIAQPAGGFASPGSTLNNAAGGGAPVTGLTYGNAFTVRCARPGTTLLSLQLGPNGGRPATPVTGYNYGPGSFPISRSDGTTGTATVSHKYPTTNSEILPVGTRPLSDISVNCSVSLTLTVQ